MPMHRCIVSISACDMFMRCIMDWHCALFVRSVEDIDMHDRIIS